MAGTPHPRALRRLPRVVARTLGVPLATAVQLLLRLSSRRAGVALVYHSLAETGGNHETELVPAHSVHLFEAEVRHLMAAYRVVPAGELREAALTRRRGQRFPVAITFDDDLSSHVRLALPVLQRVGVSATFFLSGASLTAPHMFWWERLQQAYDADAPEVERLARAVGSREASSPPLSIHEIGRIVEALDPLERDAFSETLAEMPGVDPPEAGLRAADVRTLAEAGMEVGFHTRRHDPLPALSDEELSKAMRNGRQELEDVAGHPLDVIAYPHGRADERVAAAARNAPFALGYTTAVEAVSPTSDLFLLGRLNPSYRSTGHLALQVVWALLTSHR